MNDKKKELGQVFTPLGIAEYMVDLVYFEEAKSVLDPAVGDGIFLRCLNRKKRDMKLCAYEIDPDMIELFREKNEFETELYREDYLLSDDDTKYDLIICNPPYNRFQNIPNRKKYISDFSKKYGIELSGYSNLCTYFLIKSLNELNDNGRCAFIIPYEFLNTGYGVAVKEYLLSSRMLKTVIKFDNNMSLFEDSVTTSCIMVFENKNHDFIEFACIDMLEQVMLRKYAYSVKYGYEDVKAEQKWNTYFRKDLNSSYNNLVRFDSVARVKRGIATGNNSFFALSKQQTEELGLSDDTCIKCISKSSYIKGTVFTDDDFYMLSENGKKVYLFDGERAKTDGDNAYIKHGVDTGVNRTYLNSHRNPWYQIEKKAVAPIWISVFCRNGLKVIRNETNAKNLTTFHGIYTVCDDVDFQNLFFCYLITPICRKLLLENKREYGDGLDKFEPNDLNNAMVMDISVLSKEDVDNILDIYGKIKSEGSAERYITELNDIFSGYITE